VVRYRVYAAELSVRTSHVDDGHAFLVTAATFLGIEGHEAAGGRLEIAVPSGWRVTTPLEPAMSAGEGVQAFAVPDFSTLVDSPIEMGGAAREEFQVLGVPHRLAICPADAVSRPDIDRLLSDTGAIVRTEAGLFGGALPYPAYDLILHVSSRGRGGLEHATSAALVAPSASFSSREAYLDLLSLIAHEIFHAWNVKRIRPGGLVPYRYDHECHTRLLWWFEGGTSYYDWRVLTLARLCTLDEYLDHLAAEIAYLDQTPGRLVQSLEDASFDAWIKLYRPDENSSNSGVSYYRKGEVVCALLDIELRARTSGRASLDTVLAELWRRHGATGRAVPEDGMQQAFEDTSGTALDDLFDGWVRTPAEIDYGSTFAHVGLALERTARPDGPPCSLGMRLRAEGGRTVVTSVTRPGSASSAGIDPGDELLSVAGQRVEGANVDGPLRGHAPGETVPVLVSREGRVLSRSIRLDPPRLERVKITPVRDASPVARETFAAWLGQPLPAGRRSP
jgi:predicted metalloprotease with PDZ domain